MAKIKFYPFSEGTESFAPKPEPMFKHLPDWYKKTPAVIENDQALQQGQINATVKKCMPIFDLLTAGYAILAPCDIFIDATNPDNLIWSIPISLRSFQGDMFASHALEQYSNMPIDHSKYHKTLLRIFPFWAVATEQGYSTLFMQPVYADGSPIVAMQAIVDTDSFVTDGHLSFLVEKDFKGVIKQGTPLVQVIPFKREQWESEFVSVEDAEKRFSKQRLQLRSMFVHAYKNKFRSKKEYK